VKRRPIKWCHLNSNTDYYAWYRTSSKEIGVGFDAAFSSLWKDAGVWELSEQIQRQMFWEKFKAKIVDIYYDETADGNAERQVILDFKDQAAYVLFMMEWV